MYTIYKIENGTVTTVPKISKDLKHVWIKAESPSADELAELRACINIPEEVIKDTQDMNEVPKLDKINNIPFILLQTPIQHLSSDKKIPTAYTVAPLGILLTENIILTLTWCPNGVISYLEEKLQNIAHNFIVDTTKNTQFVVKLFLFTAKLYLRYLKDIQQRLTIPTSARHKEFDKDVIALLKIEESLVYFNASLRSNDIVLDKITKRKYFSTTEDAKEILDDARDETWQAIEVVKVYGRIVEDLRNALSSLISNKLTRTVNWLTKVTVILMIPALVATFYGMNVVLPMANHPQAFWFLVGGSVILTGLGIFGLNRYQAD